MSALHEDLQILTAEPTDDVRLVYDRVAPGYDRFRERWLKFAGAEAEQAMLAELTMLDLSLQMLVRSADIPRKHVLGSVLELPFPADRFDVVVSAWVIETLPDPMRAVSEPLASSNLTAGSSTAARLPQSPRVSTEALPRSVPMASATRAPIIACMSDLREDLRLLAATPSDDVRAGHDRVAPRYDRFREHWLTAAGGEAEQVMLADLTAALEPGARVLDAGCGTGALSRQMLAVCPAIDLTMLDLSPEMLARSADIPGERLLGSVLELPFPDNCFDVVVSAWVIETVPDPLLAVSEFLRVLAPSGRLVYTFCSLPDGWLSRAGSAFVRAGVKRGFAGDFLAEDRTPWRDCGRSHRRRSRGGLTTEIALAKCCTVGPGALPDRRQPEISSRRTA